MEAGTVIALCVFGFMVLMAVLVAIISAVSFLPDFHSPHEDENN